MNVKQWVLDTEDEIIAFRHELHRRAELSFHEVRTTEFLAEKLESWGIPFRRTEPTGLVADLAGTKGDGPTVALRADIDALPIQEPEGLPFRSCTDGVMHACGHDTHMAMLLGAVKILWTHRDAFGGTVRILFQPGEETGCGAGKMIEQGALDGVSSIFGIHAVPMEPVGQISVSSGPIQASNDSFTIVIHGRASHGAAPEQGADATVAAAAVVLALQTVVSRRLPPLQPVAVTVGKLTSGAQYNIVSGRAVLEGTMRCFSKEIRAQLPDLLRSVANETAAAYGCTAELSLQGGCQVLSCDEALTILAREAALAAAESPELVVPLEMKMVSEDFAEYADKIPGSFVTVGVGGNAPLHNENMTADDAALKTGTAMHVEMALRMLARA